MRTSAWDNPVHFTSTCGTLDLAGLKILENVSQKDFLRFLFSVSSWFHIYSLIHWAFIMEWERFFFWKNFWPKKWRVFFSFFSCSRVDSIEKKSNKNSVFFKFYCILTRIFWIENLKIFMKIWKFSVKIWKFENFHENFATLNGRFFNDFSLHFKKSHWKTFHSFQWLFNEISMTFQSLFNDISMTFQWLFQCAWTHHKQQLSLLWQKSLLP